MEIMTITLMFYLFGSSADAMMQEKQCEVLQKKYIPVVEYNRCMAGDKGACAFINSCRDCITLNEFHNNKDLYSFCAGKGYVSYSTGY